MTELTGSCFCGDVAYRLTAAPMFVHACHCRDCQKQTGGPFALNALIEAENVEVLHGAPAPVEMATDSGRRHLIHRCPTCRTAVWSDYGARGVVLFVRAATLDEPERCPPDVHIYTRSKMPFIDIPAGIRVFEAYYDPKAEWPEESKARWRAVLAGDTSRG